MLITMRTLAAVAVPVVVLTTAAAAPPAAAAQAPTAGAITWSPCRQDATIDCGTLAVPVNWSDAKDGTVQLALARRKAKDPRARIGSLVVDPGGPGGSGVQLVLSDAIFSSQLKDRFDIVGFDPRGVGDSKALVCDQSVLDASPRSDPATSQGFADRVAYNRRLADNCRRRSGPLFDHVDDLSVVRDIDAIRAALGERKLTYYGVSYGTLMGQQYAEFYPDRIRALVLDSNMDHSSHTSEFFAEEAWADEAAFDEFTRWCAASDKCSLHGQDVGALFDRLYERAKQGRLHYPDQPRDPITPDDLSMLPVRLLYGPQWPQLADELASLDNGTPSALRVGAADIQLPYYLMPAFCSDWRIELTSAAGVAGQRSADAQLAPHLRISGLAWSVGLLCLGRTAPVPNPQHPYRIQGAPPILMVNNWYDPATPYAWAVDAASQIPSATLLTYEGWGHGSYDKSPCVADIVDSYLMTLALPPRDTHCPAVMPANEVASSDALPRTLF
ncbi:MAG: alpha/beta fold hydrolase [Kutzneria sp.]|nr:alpha/beta fold hydrolase [Kutzneria sp.]MBV9843782.1 alpha/beta fold hydrolase [Kutzneria sp.]